MPTVYVWRSEDKLQELALTVHHESWGLNSGHQAWQPVPLLTEPFGWRGKFLKHALFVSTPYQVIQCCLKHVDSQEGITGPRLRRSSLAIAQLRSCSTD